MVQGSRDKKEALVDALLGQASPLEREYVTRIALGEMRIGVVEGVMEEAIAKASDVDVELVKRANMLSGNLGTVARIALEKGRNGLRQISVTLFNPIKPMLAETSSLIEVLADKRGKVAFEYKFDGVRIQAIRMASGFQYTRGDSQTQPLAYQILLRLFDKKPMQPRHS